MSLIYAKNGTFGSIVPGLFKIISEHFLSTLRVISGPLRTFSMIFDCMICPPGVKGVEISLIYGKNGIFGPIIVPGLVKSILEHFLSKVEPGPVSTHR